ncbi:MAG: phage holin family protein [Ruminococcus sp.]|nr:phage holin family protein [Ruminococcus sp.]
MKYLIMLMIVVGAALADFLTGIIKAYCTGNVNSSKMRRGGLNKLAEIIVMTTVCGLDTGINALGKYYGAEELSFIAGTITAVSVFGYITVMEIISILENYRVINPEAQWVSSLVKRFTITKEENNDNDKK